MPLNLFEGQNYRKTRMADLPTTLIEAINRWMANPNHPQRGRARPSLSLGFDERVGAKINGEDTLTLLEP